MTPVTPFLTRCALALAAGAAAASTMVAFAPEAYHDLVDLRLLDLPGAGGAITLDRLVGEGLMAAFFLLLGMEALEAGTRERRVLQGRAALLPVAGAAGGMVAAALSWVLLASATGLTAEVAAQGFASSGWTAPFGTDVVIVAALGRLVFGPAHPALQVLLLAAVLDSLAGLLLTSLLAPGAEFRPAWLLVPLVAAGSGWVLLTRPAQGARSREQDRQRAQRLLPWAGLAVLSWAGVAMSGLPPALGALPVLPAMPPAARSFGLFAVAEDFLTDPMNRMARLMHGPLVGVMALFGFLNVGVDPASAGPATLVAVLSAAAGKPAGMVVGMLAAARLLGARPPAGVSAGDLGTVALLCGACLTVPALSLDRALPGGAPNDAAALGFALTALVATGVALAALWLRRR